MDEILTDDLDACKVACEANVACKSIDWNPLTADCFLNGVTAKDVPLASYPDFFYSMKRCNGK